MPGFTLYDTLGGILVYAYIGIVFVVVEKLWKGDRAVGRKILPHRYGEHRLHPAVLR